MVFIVFNTWKLRSGFNQTIVIKYHGNNSYLRFNKSVGALSFSKLSLTLHEREIYAILLYSFRELSPFYSGRIHLQTDTYCEANGYNEVRL